MYIDGIEIKNFKIQEFVPEHFYRKFGAEYSYRGIDGICIKVAQILRNNYGSIVINDWCFGGKNHQCGLRTPDQPLYNVYSDHARGKAMDLAFKHVTPKEVAINILRHKQVYRPLGITAIEVNSWDENGKGRLHVSTANFNSSGIMLIDPKKGFITEEDFLNG